MMIHLQHYLYDYASYFAILHDNIDPAIFDVLVNNEKDAFITLIVDLMLHECIIPNEGIVVATYNNKVIVKPGSCSDKEKDHSNS